MAIRADGTSVVYIACALKWSETRYVERKLVSWVSNSECCSSSHKNYHIIYYKNST
jgi:hypothetical protein